MSANKVLRLMSVDEAIEHAVYVAATDEQGERITPKQVAGRMGIDDKLLYDIASGRRKARLSEAAAIVRGTRCFLPIDIVEDQIARVGIRLPVIGGTGDASVAKVALMCREFGEFMERYGEYGADRVWTAAEVDDVERQLRDVYAVGMEVVSNLRAQVSAAKAGGRR